MAVAVEIDAAAYDHAVTLSEELGLDLVFRKTVADCFGRAIADGHGQQELTATLETLPRIVLEADLRLPYGKDRSAPQQLA